MCEVVIIGKGSYAMSTAELSAAENPIRAAAKGGFESALKLCRHSKVHLRSRSCLKTYTGGHVCKIGA
jgi:hypothetical protein